MKNLTEQELINGCKQNDRSIQKSLYEQYAPKMMAVCMRYAKHREEAEDILQEGFMKVFSYINMFRNEGSFEGWIRRTIVNTALNHYKANLKYALHQDYEIIERQQNKVHINAAIENMTTEYILDTLQKLPEGYKLVFNLYEIEGYSHKEIGEMLNISVNTSKSQLLKAKRYIQTKLLEKQDF